MVAPVFSSGTSSGRTVGVAKPNNTTPDASCIEMTALIAAQAVREVDPGLKTNCHGDSPDDVIEGELGR